MNFYQCDLVSKRRLVPVLAWGISKIADENKCGFSFGKQRANWWKGTETYRVRFETSGDIAPIVKALLVLIGAVK